MRNPIVQILILSGVIIAETTLLNGVGISGVRPAFYLVCFIFLAYSQGSVYGVLIGFSTGLVLDFISIAPLGFSALSLSLIGYGLSSLKGKLFLDPIFMPILLTVVVSILNWLLAVLIVSLFQIDPSTALFSGSILLQIALHGLNGSIIDKGVADHQGQMAGFSHFDQCISVAGNGCQGFFNQHMLAGRQTLAGDTVMCGCGCADDYGIDIVMCEHLIEFTGEFDIRVVAPNFS